MIGSQSCNNKIIAIWSLGRGLGWRLLGTSAGGERRGVSSSMKAESTVILAVRGNPLGEEEEGKRGRVGTSTLLKSRAEACGDLEEFSRKVSNVEGAGENVS